MICQSFIYIVTILIIQIPQRSTEQCAYYYLLLEKEDFFPVWEPTQVSKVSWTYEMNTTEEYNIIKNNLDCVLELNCDFIPDNYCKPPIKTDNRARHEFILTGSSKPTPFSALPIEETTNKTTSLVPTTDESTTLPATSDLSTLITQNPSQSTTIKTADKTTSLVPITDKITTIPPTPDQSTIIIPTPTQSTTIETAEKTTTLVQTSDTITTISPTPDPSSNITTIETEDKTTSFISTTIKITTIPPNPDQSTIITPTPSQSTSIEIAEKTTSVVPTESVNIPLNADQNTVISLISEISTTLGSMETTKGSVTINPYVTSDTPFSTEPTSITNLSKNTTLNPSNPETMIINLEIFFTTRVIDTTVNTYYVEAEQLKEKRNARVRIAVTVIGGLAGTSLLIFLLRWCKDVAQSGTYRFPDPGVDESLV